MADPMDKITEGKDILGKIRNSLAGFLGYFDRENRRDADKLLRESIADRYEEQWSRVSAIQRELISEGQLELIDDVEAAAIKMRTFVDKVRRGAYGYAGFFDAVRVKSDELEQLYNFDMGLLENVDAVIHAVDNLQASLGSDGLPAAIRNLVTLSEEAIQSYDRRKEVILNT